jgi:hypothetical protein
MRVFFNPVHGASTEGPGYKKEWDLFISNLPQTTSSYSITDNANKADVIISPSALQLDNANLKAILKPLSHHDISHFVWDLGDKPVGRLSGFYCSLQNSLFDKLRHRSMCYPITFNELVDDFPQEDVTFNFGFVGGVTARVRERLFHIFKPTERQNNSLFQIQPSDWSKVFDRTGSQSKRAYANFLRKTRFILCPRGYGVGSARLFETLKAGRVPVIISDGYVLPSGIDWNNCSIRIKEGEIRNIPEVICSKLDDWSRMAFNARDVFVTNFSEQTVVSYMVKNVNQIRTDCLKEKWWSSPLYSAKVAAAYISHYSRPALGAARRNITGKLKVE